MFENNKVCTDFMSAQSAGPAGRKVSNKLHPKPITTIGQRLASHLPIPGYNPGPQSSHVASLRREGRYRCCKDVLAVMGTVQAGRGTATAKEHVQTLAKQQHWPEGSRKQLPQFRGFKGAGRHGVGCTKRAMRDLYLKQEGQPDSS